MYLLVWCKHGEMARDEKYYLFAVISEEDLATGNEFHPGWAEGSLILGDPLIFEMG